MTSKTPSSINGMEKKSAASKRASEQPGSDAPTIAAAKLEISTAATVSPEQPTAALDLPTDVLALDQAVDGRYSRVNRDSLVDESAATDCDNDRAQASAPAPEISNMASIMQQLIKLLQTENKLLASRQLAKIADLSQEKAELIKTYQATLIELHTPQPDGPNKLTSLDGRTTEILKTLADTLEPLLARNQELLQTASAMIQVIIDCYCHAARQSDAGEQFYTAKGNAKSANRPASVAIDTNL